AGDVEKLSLQATFPQFAGMEQKFGSLIWGGWMRRWDTHLAVGAPPATPTERWSLFVTLKDGLSSLIQSLQKQIKDVTVQTGQPVVRVSPRENQYEIVLSGKKLLVDAVAVTTDATMAAEFVQPWDERLSRQLFSIPYVSTATVSLGFRRKDLSHPLKGFGYVVPRAERKTILAVTWSSSKFDGRATASEVLIRSFVGGAHQEEVVDLPDDQLMDAVSKECGSVLGISGEPTASCVYKWRKANPQYNVGHLSLIAEIEKASAKHPGFFLAGAAYKGVGIPDCVQQGWETSEKMIRFLKASL
ncbi:MAG: protoporphyrinogen oxidase, partial [Nitrospirae bacterium]|nr:protoporphyrinogen oxidase [Candidatus Troglogloeales bacterium]